MKLQVALLQLLPGQGLEKQYEIGEAACRQAKELGADIALFPEMWSDGYEIPQDAEELEALAIDADSAFVRGFGRLAAELELAVGITFLEKREGRPRNSFLLFDRKGERKLYYAKVHTCEFGDERMLCAGDDFYVTDLDTAKGTVKIGCMICYDREFPESARILMLKGAEVVLVPNACPMEINRLSQLRGRAYENMMGIATCNYPEGKPDCNGHSSAFDGAAYLPGQAGSRDTCILEAGGAPGVYLACFDLEMMRAYRSREVHGNAYRRPEKYGLLLAREKEAPFLRRTDAGGGKLHERYVFRRIRPEETEQAAQIEQICFPPNEACTREKIAERAAAAPELFLVAEDRKTGRLAGFLNGLATDETVFRDEFFQDAGLYNPRGRHVMLLGLDVLPEHRGQGLARELVRQYCCREQKNGRTELILTCLEDKVRMYEKMGFCDRGIANSSWGGEQWHEMSRALQGKD